MPSLKYYDPTALTYKYLVGGLSQETADARYLMSGFRNVIRNGDMSIAQRGNGPFTTPGSYTLDGYKFSLNTGSLTINRVAQAVGGGSPWLQSAVSGHTLPSAYAILAMPIEGVATLAGKQVVLSFDAVAASGNPKIALELIQNFGTGGSPSSSVLTPVGTVTVSTTKARYSFSFIVPSITSKVMGTSGTDRLEMDLWLSAGSDYAARAPIGIQNNTFSITDVQLEEGPVATPFERLPVQQQFAWCQRYFQRMSRVETHRFFNGAWVSASQSWFPVPFAVPMRAIPTMVYVGTFSVYTGSANVLATLASHSVSEEAFTISATGYAGAGGGGDVLQLHSGTGGAYIAASAEL